MTPAQTAWLRALRNLERFEEFDLQLAGMFARQDPQLPESAMWAIACLSQQIQRGAVCLTLAGLAAETPPAVNPSVPWPANAADWVTLLRRVPAVGVPGQIRPLVLDGSSGRFYSYRHWDLEQRLARELRQRAGWAPVAEARVVRRALNALFPADEPAVSLQGLAAALAASGRITVLTGGPGTGKTTTLARMLAVLLHARPASRVALVAPTGKAAARMEEALGGALARLPAQWGVTVPAQATT